jgi:hypothetical protein
LSNNDAVLEAPSALDVVAEGVELNLEIEEGRKDVSRNLRLIE